MKEIFRVGVYIDDEFNEFATLEIDGKEIDLTK